MIRFDCECGKTLQAREENAGMMVRCPACQRTMTVPNVPATSIQSEEPVEAAPPRQRVQRERPELPEDEDKEPAASSGKAIASLVFGILSLFCNVLTGLPALIVGTLALRDIGRSRGRLTGRGVATAGIITACAGTLLSCVGYGVGVLPFLLLPAVQKVREAAARAQSQNNLKQMIIGMHNYNDVNHHLPAAAICDRNGKPLLSWRVAILPYVEQQQLYKQFKLDEPWDSPNNIKLLARMPKIYQLPGDDQTPPDSTHYQVFVGNGAAFEKTRGYSIPMDFPDGTSNTILIVETAQAVPWTKPDDIAFDPNKPIKPLLSTYFKSGCQAALADGQVKVLSNSISEFTLKTAIMRNDGGVPGPDW
jgi:hypothetical protein